MTGPLAAVLWDMDGVLVDTEPIWTRAEEELAARLGGTWSAELKALIVGTRLDVAIPTILSWYGRPVTPVEVAASSAFLLGRMVELYDEHLTPLPGVTALLASLQTAGIPMALVSSSYRVLVDAVLARGFGPFALTLAGDEVTHGKPHPEPYLTAARRLGVPPGACVVIEDSPAGVAAAEAAGCAVVAVPSLAAVAFAAAPRRLLKDSLEQVDVHCLTTLMSSMSP